MLKLWRKLWCPHYYEKLRDLSEFEKEWICIRGCGKRKVLKYGLMPFSSIHVYETVVDNKLVSPHALLNVEDFNKCLTF